MKGQTVVLDSSNIEAVIADAVSTPETDVVLPKDSGVPAPAAPANQTAAVESKDGTAAAAQEGDEDIAGELTPLGLTAEQQKVVDAAFKKQIGKKHRLMKDAEEFAAEQYNERRLAEQRAEAQDREIARLKAQLTPAPVVEAPKEPKREDFKSDQEYIDARVDWQTDQRLKAKEAEAAQQREKERQQEILTAAAARINHAKEIVPDYVEVTEAVDWPVPVAIAGYMQESEMFAELGYYLAQHAEERTRLEKLTPQRQLVEIGKIESRLQPFAAAPKADAKASNGKEQAEASPKPSTNGAKPSTETGTVPSKPRAPAPITPLSAGSATQVEKPPSERTYAEERAAWQRKHGANFDKRKRH